MTTPTREQVVQWMSAAGFNEEQWAAMTYNSYPHKEVTMLTHESEQLISLARADLEATVKEQAAEIERLSERRCEICGYAEHHREHTGCLRQQLAAAQLHIEQLRGAMLMMLCDSEGKCFMAGSVKDRFIIDTALSTQPDRSALEADRQRVAEACAKVCDAHNDFYRNGIVCGEKIRAGQWKDHMK